MGADYSNELFRFSTTKQQWEQLNTTRPPSARTGHGMASVWVATSTCLGVSQEGAQILLLLQMSSFGSGRRSRSGRSSMRNGSRDPQRAQDPVMAWWENTHTHTHTHTHTQTHTGGSGDSRSNSEHADKPGTRCGGVCQ